MSLVFLPEPDAFEIKTRETVRRVANTHLRPQAIADDEASRFRREAYNELAKHRVMSLVIPKEYGGDGLSHFTYYACLEEIARASAAMAITAGVTNLVQGGINRFGSAFQKENFLKRVASGEWIGAFSLSEPGSGSDAAALRTTAKRVNGGYRITGTKMWCSTAGNADLYLLIARTAEHKTKGTTAFLVSRDTPGFKIGKMERKLGLCASSLAELIFEDCFVPEDRRLGQEGEGLSIAFSELDGGRITIGAIGVGLAIEAIERVWKFFLKTQGSVPENVKAGCARFFAEAQSLRSLLRVAAGEKDAKRSVAVIAAQMKLLGSDLAMNVTSQAVEWMGEAGYVKENEVERLFRDAKALQIVEGTNQIQPLVIAREMEGMFK